jgi:ABC-type uncharacterized transport system permease subunit
MLYYLTRIRLHVHTMTQRRSLTLDVAQQSDHAIAAGVLCGLALLAAILAPRPLMMSIVVTLICAAGWAAYILGFSKFRSEKLTVVIFPDGQIRLESDHKDATGGLLNGQQWSTRFFAVLHVTTTAGNRYLPVLSRLQHADDYRRLSMWLRQDFCRGASDKTVPGF